MSEKNNSIVQMFGRSVRMGIVSILLALSLIVCSAIRTRADGEIILFPGDRYPIPCLQQMRSDREYDISVENPDIVGLDETGRCIVAIAVGTTEVTVRISEPDEAYTYVFAVAEYYGLNQAEGNTLEEYRTDELFDSNAPGSEDIYEEETTNTGPVHSENADDRGGVHTFMGENADSNSSEAARTAKEESTCTDESQESRETETERVYTDRAREADAPESQSTREDESVGIYAPESDSAVQDVPKEFEASVLKAAPVTFTHGTGKYDILVPPHYTLWICARSAGPISILYVGTDGIRLPYRKEGNMIFIDSGDLPSGRSCIQILAADKEGRISAMEGYEIVRA